VRVGGGGREEGKGGGGGEEGSGEGGGGGGGGGGWRGGIACRAEGDNDDPQEVLIPKLNKVLALGFR